MENISYLECSDSDSDTCGMVDGKCSQSPIRYRLATLLMATIVTFFIPPPPSTPVFITLELAKIGIDIVDIVDIDDIVV